MTKDYITVTNSDGNVEQMEVVATFRLEETAKNYIIYKELHNEKFYAASYDDDTEYTNLNTDFNEVEKEQLQRVFETLKVGGETNA